jgi:hypothetical protein
MLQYPSMSRNIHEINLGVADHLFPMGKSERKELQTTLISATHLVQEVVNRMASEVCTDRRVSYDLSEIIKMSRLTRMTLDEKALMQQYFLIKSIQKSQMISWIWDNIHGIYSGNKISVLMKGEWSPITNYLNRLSAWKPTNAYMYHDRFTILEGAVDGIFYGPSDESPVYANIERTIFLTPAQRRQEMLGAFSGGRPQPYMSDSELEERGLAWVYRLSLHGIAQNVLHKFPDLGTKAADITQKVVDLVR